MSGGTITVARPLDTGGTHVAMDAGHCASAENVLAWSPPGRPRNSASPCVVFVPAFVTMLMAALDVHPNSAEHARDITFISCTSPTGMVENIVCRPHGPSSV